MALRTTPTIAICLAAGVAAGIALARPADQDPPAAAASAEAATAEASADVATGDVAAPDNDSPYLVDATPPPAGDDVEAPEPPAAPASIGIEGFDFTSIDAVAGGSPITVTNFDGADHTLTARNGEFDTGNLGQDQSVSIAAPSAPGTYEFFCVIHPSMTGTLVVS